MVLSLGRLHVDQSFQECSLLKEKVFFFPKVRSRNALDPKLPTSPAKYESTW